MELTDVLVLALDNSVFKSNILTEAEARSMTNYFDINVCPIRLKQDGIISEFEEQGNR